MHRAINDTMTQADPNSQKQVSTIAITLALLAIALFGWQNVIELRAEEPRRALISLEMLFSEDYLISHINGWVYYNKPPLFNWIMVFFFKIFGSTDTWVVRLPSLLGFVGLAITHYFFSRKYIGHNAALFSALACITGIDLLLYASINTGEIDLLYAFVVYLQAIAIFHFQQRKEYWRMYLITYFLTFVGFMLKGLPSLAFQAITLLFWLSINKQAKKLFHPAHFVGIILLGALFFSYFYPVSLRAQWEGILARQFVEASIRSGLETHWTDTLLQSFINPLRFAQLLLPWSLLLIPIFRFRDHRRTLMSGIKENPFLTFCAVFIVANIGLYWFTADFKSRYQYMFFPFVLSLLFYPKGLAARWYSGAIFMTLMAIAFLALPFIDYFKPVPNIYLKSILVSLALSATILLYLKKNKGLIYLILFMAIIRIGYNETYLRAWALDDEVNKNIIHAERILAVTHMDPVYLYATPLLLKNDLSVGPLSFGRIDLKVSTLIPYQIPYTISQANGHVVQFREELESGGFYIAETNLVDTNIYAPLYRFRDTWQKRDYVLIEP